MKRWFRGRLGRVAGFAYILSAATLIASFMVAGSPTMLTEAQAETVTMCHATPADTAANGWVSISISADGTVLDSQHSTQHDADIIPAFEWTDQDGLHSYPGKNLTANFSGYTGQQILANHCSLPTPSNTPVPTNTFTPSATPTNSSTPSDTPTASSTPINTATASSTPTNTPTMRPSRTPTDTMTPTPSNTLDPSITPSATSTASQTPTPSDTPTSTPTFTPTNTSEPPHLVDPKVDSLVEDNDNNGVVSPGDVIEYVITITNDGGSTAEDVSFSDTPDANTFLVVGSVTTTHGSVTTGNTAGDSSIFVDIGDLTAGDTVTITFDVTIDPNLPSNVTEVSNHGLVSGENFPDQPTDDPDTGDADDPTDTPIVHPEPGPTNTPSDPGDPGDPEPTPNQTPQTPLLIPVTGVDLTGGGMASGMVFNMGLALLGLALVVHAWSLRSSQSSEESH